MARECLLCCCPAAVLALPARFDELPVAQLPASHDDPRIAAGLELIRQLDEQLKEAWIKVGALRRVLVRLWVCVLRHKNMVLSKRDPDPKSNSALNSCVCCYASG
jgi:hypothetical protein